MFRVYKGNGSEDDMKGNLRRVIPADQRAKWIDEWLRTTLWALQEPVVEEEFAIILAPSPAGAP